MTELTERDRTIAGRLEKGTRVMVLCNPYGSGLCDHLHPVLRGPAVVDTKVRTFEDGLFGVFMVPDFLPEPLKGLKVGAVVHVSQLALVPPGSVLSYPNLELDWTDEGVMTHD